MTRAVVVVVVALVELVIMVLTVVIYGPLIVSDVEVMLNLHFPSSFCGSISRALWVKLVLGEGLRIPLIISQHKFR